MLLMWHHVILLACGWQAAMAASEAESYQARKSASKGADDLEAARDTISVMQCQLASSDDVAHKVPPALGSLTPNADPKPWRRPVTSSASCSARWQHLMTWPTRFFLPLAPRMQVYTGTGLSAAKLSASDAYVLMVSDLCTLSELGRMQMANLPGIDSESMVKVQPYALQLRNDYMETLLFTVECTCAIKRTSE